MTKLTLLRHVSFLFVVLHAILRCGSKMYFVSKRRSHSHIMFFGAILLAYYKRTETFHMLSSVLPDLL